MQIKNIFYKFFLLVAFVFCFTGCVKKENTENLTSTVSVEKIIEENNKYYSKEDVALYIEKFNKLPPNYLTKRKAKALGWNPKEGNLWEVTDKAVIGGDYFGNYEEKLPESSYRECDVNYKGGKRNSERLIYDDKGNIYYTKDHYNSFERIENDNNWCKWIYK